jgi:hypothetical protein
MDDPRFEWLGQQELDEALWWLACAARAQPAERRLADDFVDEYRPLLLKPLVVAGRVAA